MRNKLGLILSFIIMVAVLSGCGLTPDKEKTIFQYKGSYVGDNSAVSQITHSLPSPEGEQVSSLELKTTEEPYGVIINYEQIEGEESADELNYKQTAIHHASFLLLLIQNAEWVTYNFDHAQYTISKAELEEWYGKPLNTFVSELQLTSFMEYYLIDEQKINQLFEIKS